VIAALLADPALQRILAVLPDARIVGGAVRDALVGAPVADIDLATPEPPEVSQARLADAGLRVLPTGLAHGTVTAISNDRPFEITTLRRDVSTDGRHAEVAWTTDWRADAARRDFTINAMSLDRRGSVHDYFEGRADLAAGTVRFVGDPATRIAEDYLRSLRYFRFFARYAKGPPDAAATAAIRDAVPGLARLSAERVWSELKRILAAPDPAGAVGLMAELGVLAAIMPEGAAPARLTALLAANAPPDPLLRVAALLTGDAAAFGARLSLARAETDRLVALRAGALPRPDASDADLRRLLADEDGAVLIDRTFVAGGAGPAWESLRARIAATPRPIFPLEGRDALALGAAPGPAIGVALRQTRAAWLAAGCTQTAEALRPVLRDRLRMVEARIHPIARADIAAPSALGGKLLTLNNRHAQALSWLTEARLIELVGHAFVAWRIGDVEAFILAFDQDAPYDGENFLWFKARYPRFIYVDRVVVAEAARGRGYAKRLYADLFATAARRGHSLIACEVNADPPNLESDMFHKRFGFQQVGSASLRSDEKTVRYLLRDLAH
jgi:poly(A) polymerase/tRNA nucleotidyltransferase (CCA-adding enzyme)